MTTINFDELSRFCYAATVRAMKDANLELTDQEVEDAILHTVLTNFPICIVKTLTSKYHVI